MATVHLGRWVGSGGFNKTVAVKVLHPQFAGDPRFVDMFLDEARVVGRIRHPHVVPTIDLIDEDGELFIVMDYVEGITLSRLMSLLKHRGEHLPPAIVKRILWGVLQGLQAAHEATDPHGEPLGIIHRDVSPENIIVGSDGYARLIDFGIARAMGRVTVTQQGIIKGKPSYLAPEQIIGQPLGAHTDIYSASVVMWHALTGRKLFVGNTPAEQVFKILRMPVAPPSRLAEGVSQRLDEIVMRGLARHARQRWPSAQAMAEELERDGMASYRKVGELIRGLDAAHLEERAHLVRAIESAPLPPRSRRMVADAPRDSLPDDVVAMHAARIADEPSRTSLTSEADARFGPDGRGDLSRRSLFGVVAVAAAVALVVAAAVSSIDVAPRSGAAASSAPTSEPAASDSAAPSSHVPAEASAEPQPTSTPEPASSAPEVGSAPSAEPTSPTPPRGPARRWTPPKRRPFIPNDI